MAYFELHLSSFWTCALISSPASCPCKTSQSYYYNTIFSIKNLFLGVWIYLRVEKVLVMRVMTPTRLQFSVDMLQFLLRRTFVFSNLHTKSRPHSGPCKTEVTHGSQPIQNVDLEFTHLFG